MIVTNVRTILRHRSLFWHARIWEISAQYFGSFSINSVKESRVKVVRVFKRIEQWNRSLKLLSESINYMCPLCLENFKDFLIWINYPSDCAFLPRISKKIDNCSRCKPEIRVRCKRCSAELRKLSTNLV